MSVICAAIWEASHGEEERVRDLLRQLVAANRTEPGVIDYIAVESQDQPGSFRIFESYVDEAAFRTHNESEHFERIVLRQVLPLLSRRERMLGTALVT